jgi:peptide/nickel transport system substrate-binding protein
MIWNLSRQVHSRCKRVALAVTTISAGLLLGMPLGVAQIKGEIVVAGALLRQQFDPTVMVAITDYNAYDLLFDGLLNLDSKGKYPALATRWTVSADGKQIDFELRKNVHFHNGDAFSAEDVKFTYETIIKEGNTHSYRKAFADAIERIEVIDPARVRFILKQPWPAFFSSARYGLQPIVPKAYYERVGAKEFLGKPVGTGPFKLAGMKAGEWSRFEVNSEYWGHVAEIKAVTQKMVKEPFTLYAMVEKGEADVVFGLSGALLDKVKSGNKVRIFESKYSGTSGMYFNKTKFPASADKRVRLAVAYALNRAEIAKRVLGGICEPATSIFTPATFGYLAGLQSIPYDPAKAKQLLAEAGVKPGTEITFTLHSESFGSLPSAPQVLEALAGNLEAVGFKVVRESVDTSGWLAMMRAKKQPAVFYGPSSMPDDGGETIDGWFTSKALWSSGNIQIPEYDAIAKAQAEAVDLKKREEMLQSFAKLENKNLEAVPLFWCSTTFAAGPRIKQWSPAVSSAYHYNFQSMKLAE